VRARTRTDRGSALETITPTKQRRLARAAQHYLSFARPSGMTAIRFDVIAITGDEVIHLRDAFRL
jgi:putative endonuclease